MFESASPHFQGKEKPQLDYHTSLSSLRNSINQGCTFCTFVDQFMRQRGIYFGEDVETKLEFLPQTNWFYLWYFPKNKWVREKSKDAIFFVTEVEDFYELPYMLREYLHQQDFPVPLDESFAVACYNHCLHSHRECASQDVWYPTRLLSIITGGSVPKLRLVRRTDLSHGNRYVALSHCWGQLGQIITLTHKNIAAMEASIEYSSLPRTFQDAVTVAGWLKISYIWIDSLCIIQDSIDDWQRESATMDQVYKYASCTISADRATDSSMGCFRNESAVCPRLVKTQKQGNFWLHDKGSRHGWTDARLDFDNEPLAKRAWALQERFLSNRILHFCSAQLKWECNELATSQFCFLAQDPCFFGRDPIPKNAAYTNLLEGWTKVVKEYSRRALTKEDAKLIALGGITKAYQKALNSDFIAGHWRRQLPYSLLWHRADGAEAHRPSGYRTPSWSWASIDCEIDYGYEFDILRRFGESGVSLVSILETQLDSTSDDPNSRINGGFLCCLGILQYACWSPVAGFGPARPENIALCSVPLGEKSYEASTPTTYLTTVHAIFDVVSECDESKQLYCLPMHWYGGISGLILCDDNLPGRYRRMGIFRATDNRPLLQVEPNFHNASQFAALKYSRTAAPIDVQKAREQWEDLVKKSDGWLSLTDIGDGLKYKVSVGRDDNVGPHRLYSNDPALIEGFEKLVPQIITIV